MVQAKVKIISNLRAAPGHFEMILEAPDIAQAALPGQFIHLRVHEGLDPLLRRPFSIHRIKHQAPGTRHQIEILYKIRGKATEILSTRKCGELLDVIGPLGNGFPVPEEHQSSRAAGANILVGGGIGVAPLLFLAEKLMHSPRSRVYILIGAKTKNLILCREEFKQLGCQIKIATEDGSYGFKGLVTDLLQDLLSTINYKPSATIYAAGPIFMLQEIKRIAKIFKILAFGSLEENIACGLGACLGCAVKTSKGYKRVCKEGPVFNLEEVNWE